MGDIRGKSLHKLIPATVAVPGEPESTSIQETGCFQLLSTKNKCRLSLMETSPSRFRLHIRTSQFEYDWVKATHTDTNDSKRPLYK